MSRLWAADAVSEAPDGSTQRVDRERMRDMRDFERAMHARWSWSIQDVGASEVTVHLTEANDLYDSLGAGQCVQVVVYSVRGGKIARMATQAISYSGQPFRGAFSRFKTWLLTTSAAADPRIVRDGHIRFTGESARCLGHWLQIWHTRRLA